MTREHIENEILQLALGASKKNLQMQVEVETVKQDYKADHLLRMVLQRREVRFYAEIKATLNKAGIALRDFNSLRKHGHYEDTAHPILVYADIIVIGNQRNIETAKVVYEQHIIRLIRED